jgi:hypothetical protein
VQIKKLHDPDDSLDYWLSKSIEERFAALEYLRQEWMSHAAQISVRLHGTKTLPMCKRLIQLIKDHLERDA